MPLSPTLAPEYRGEGAIRRVKHIARFGLYSVGRYPFTTPIGRILATLVARLAL